MPAPALRFKNVLFAATALTAPVLGQELPTGASVQSGSVGIATPGPGAMTIKQSSQKAIVNWQSFSIGKGGVVDIAQPNVEAALLNRVTGSATTTIAGSLNANGQIFIVNPNGIAITGSGTVNAGGFVASTLNISNADFRAGDYKFAGDGSSGAVSNAGTVNIASGGYAALIGGRVDNTGVISAPLGRIGLGAGELATLDLAGDGFLQVALPSRNSDDGALVTNSGTISADGGRVVITAAAAQDAARNVVNLSGITQARTVSGRSGAIVLGGGGGGVEVTGSLDVSAPAPKTAPVPKTRPAALGGSVTITGAAIELAGATINASGADGGGSVKIGGDFAGAGSLPHARTVSIDAATRITADATVAGDGGEIALWSNYGTRFAGTITARGAGMIGSGGYVEVSSPRGLSYTGVTDLRAPSGNYGTLLLDPYNVIITSGSSTITSLAITPTSDDFEVVAEDLEAQLALANVTIATGGAGSPGTQAGNITLDASLAWGAPTALTLDAFGDIVFNSGIAAVNGGLVLTAGGDIIFEGSEGMTIAVGALGLEALAGGGFFLNGDTTIASGGDVVVDTSQFINNSGPEAIDATGRTLIYSTSWEDDERGGLTGSNLYGRTYDDDPPGTIPGTGDVFIYSDQPVLTVFIENGTRVYRNPDSLTADVTYGLTVNGDTLAEAVAGNITDTAAVTAGAGFYDGALTAAGLTSPIGYVFSVEGGDLTITPASLTITASDLSKLFGQTLVFGGTEFTVAGLYSGDTVESIMLASPGAAAGASIEGSPYVITASNASGTGLANYTIAYQPGSLTVLPAADTGPSGAVLVGDGPTIVNPPDTLPTSLAPEPAEDDLRLSLQVLQLRTNDFRQRLAVCGRDVAEDEEAAGLYISCVSDALEEYASDIEDPLIRLPPELQAVSSVMRQTVQQLRAAASAPTPQAAVAQARAAIGNLVDFVRQQTELVSAVDPETEALLVEHGNVIASAVEEMDLALVGAVEI